MKLPQLYIIPVIAILLFPVQTMADSAEPKRQVIVYYFYTNARCPSCLDMERWTGETLKSEFPDSLDSGALVWNPVNLNGKGNYRFVKDYKLYTKSVILSEKMDGREVLWKNLDKVWTLLNDRDAFHQYVRGEVAAYLEPR